MPTERSVDAAPTLNAAQRGRADLQRWVDAAPDNLYTDDLALQALVRRHGLMDRAPSLTQAGRDVAGPLDRVVRENNLARNLPVLDDWDAIGNFTAGVSHHPSWRAAGQLIYGTGIMAAYGEAATAPSPPHRYILALFYLTAQAGEAGHNCPLACAAGAIRTLQKLGTPTQQQRYLRPLLDPDFRTNFTASQFLTEVQGGSDVGANAVIAVPRGDGAEGRAAGSRWTISGEKWFCSNADADVFLMTARVGPPSAGTRGLGLFLVPRLREDGQPNGFRIRRLKDKLGTRSMASAELDFVDAEAEALGPVDAGFKHVMELVITTSRLFNAMGCAGHAHRAWVVASTYAAHRQAFGQPIANFVVVQETLAWMRSDAVACLAGTLTLADVHERVDAGTATDQQRAFHRVGVNLNKLRTAIVAHECVNRGIEILGGNGAIESFSVLPRLLRDNVVYENWEGTHNVLRAQVLRDCARFGVHEGFFAELKARLPGDHDALHADLLALRQLLAGPADLAALAFRRLADRMATWVQLAGMAGVPELSTATTMTRRHIAEVVLDDAYVKLLASYQRAPLP